jgi:hypothetical protein
MSNRFDYCKFYVIVSFAIIAVIVFVYVNDLQQQLLQFDTIVNQFFKLPNLSLSTTLSATPVVVIKDLNISEQRAFSKICHGQRKQFNWSTFTDQFLLRKQFYNRFDVNNYVPDLQVCEFVFNYRDNICIFTILAAYICSSVTFD